MKKTKSIRKGFTLIEILVAIGIMAVMVSLIVPNLLGAREQSNDGMATTLQNQLNGTYQDWKALGGKIGSQSSGSEGDLCLSLLNVLTSDANSIQGDGGSAGADEAEDSSGVVNSSAIRTQLNAGELDVNTDGTGVNYGDFLITFTASGNDGAFTVTSTN